MTKKLAVRISALAVIAAVVAFAAACPAKDAAVAVNKYAKSLSALQDGEIKLHNSGTVDNAFHVKFQKSLKIASQAGHALDGCIAVADKGGDTSGCIAAAENAYAQVIAVIGPSNDQELVELGQAAGIALQNAISLIKAIHPSQQPSPGMALWLGLGLVGLVGTGPTVVSIVNLINLIAGLEPIAFDLVVKLAEDLKGKTADEILAMNESIFGKVDATADAEIAATEGGAVPDPAPPQQ